MLVKNRVELICIAEIAIVEFFSAVWKKVRMKVLTDEDGHLLTADFMRDLSKFAVISKDKEIINKACSLIEIHRNSGLRTLDSIQLAVLISLSVLKVANCNSTFLQTMVLVYPLDTFTFE